MAVAAWDRGAASWSKVDGRGRGIAVYRQLARPIELSAGRAMERSVTERYLPRWYEAETRYDAADRPVWQTIGAETKELRGAPVRPFGAASGGPASTSAVSTSYTGAGKVRAVAGSYGPLVRSVSHHADGRVEQITYGDIAETKTAFLYDERRRVSTVQTYRGPPSIWTMQGALTPAAKYGVDAEPGTWPLLLQDTDYLYDAVGNPVEVRDWRLPDEWPAGAKPVTKKLAYDDLNRVQKIAYQYSEGDDLWVDPFQAELDAAEGGQSRLEDPRRARPSPRVSFEKRVKWQTFEYDWLGNQTATGDDAGGFYDRSLGKVENGPVAGAAYRLLSAKSTATRAAGADLLRAEYDGAGNTVGLTVVRGGACVGGTCSQRYGYQWDELGRLVRARRWDLGLAEAEEPWSVEREREAPAAELRYRYDGGDERVLKTAVDEDGDERHALYVFASLELRGAKLTQATGEAAADYERTALTEVGYLFANGVRLARLVFEPATKGVPLLDEVAAGVEGTYPAGSELHVFFELGDHLGSTSVVLDQATSELVEATTYLGYGATESDYRPARWGAFREDYRFTGKEEDSEVGLTYFGKRFLSAQLGRWLSADPLAVHAPGEADLNLYAYVSGRVLQAVDPVGLEGEELVEHREVDPEAGRWESEFRGDDYTRIVPSQFDRSEHGDPTYIFDDTPEDRIEGRGQSQSKGTAPAPSPPSRAAPAPAPSASSPEQTSIEPPAPSAPQAAAPSAPTSSSAGAGGSSKSEGLEAAKGFLDVVSMLPIPFVGSAAALASVAISAYQGKWGEAALGVAGAAAGIFGAAVLVKGATLAGRALKAGKAAKAAKPSLSAYKEALKKVYAEVGGPAPRGKPGKFGSPQAGDAKKGYRLDPPHDGAAMGDAESGFHFNWWDYTVGKRGRGGRSGAIPIED